MKKSTLFFSALTLCIVSFMTFTKAEARTHFSINFNCGPSVVERVITPPQVYERVIVPAYCVPERLYAAPRPVIREVHVVPGVRQRAILPAAGFSFGFFR